MGRDTLDPETLAALRRKLDEAGEVRWRYQLGDEGNWWVQTDAPCAMDIAEMDGFGQEQNAALIAALRNAAPDLLAALAAQAEEVERLRRALEPFGSLARLFAADCPDSEIYPVGVILRDLRAAARALAGGGE